MSEPHPRTKYWVTDPPATFDDEEGGIIILAVFTTRSKLREYYRAVEGLPSPKRSMMQQRRFGQLRKDIMMLGWQGITIDPDPEGGDSRILRYDTGVPFADTPQNEIEEFANALLERPADAAPNVLRKKQPAGSSEPKPEITTGKPDVQDRARARIVGSD